MPLVVRAIARLSPQLCYLCTTNLDSLLERALEFKWTAFDRERPDLKGRPRSIMKLCGSVDQVSSWVLTERRLTDRPAELPQVGCMLRSHVLVIVGYRADDELLRRLVLPLRGRMSPAWPAEAPGNLALVPADSVTPGTRALLERGTGQRTPARQAAHQVRPQRDSPPPASTTPPSGPLRSSEYSWQILTSAKNHRIVRAHSLKPPTMLHSLTLQNFKPISEPIELVFGDVTLLAGLNSSGKSSVLQAILMISQTFGHSNYERALVPNGNQVQLGLLSQVKNEMAKPSEPLTIGFQIVPERSDREQNSRIQYGFRARIARLSVSASFQPTDVDTGVMHSEVGSKLVSLSMEIQLNYRRSVSLHAVPMTLKEFDDYAQGVSLQDKQRWRFEEGVPYRTTIRTARQHQELPLPLEAGEVVGIARMRHFMPERLIVRERLDGQKQPGLNGLLRFVFDIDPPEGFLRDAVQGLPYVLPPEIVDGFYEYVTTSLGKTVKADLSLDRERTLDGFLSWIRSVILLLQPGKLKKVRDNLSRKMKRDVERWFDQNEIYEFATLQTIEGEIVEEAVREASNFFFGKIRYLGPLRADPQTLQSFSPSSELDDVGSRGQYAAPVYDANRAKRIRWWNPVAGKEDFSTLEHALNTWIQHIGVAHQVHTSEARETGVAWRVLHRPGSQDRPLSAVGVGVSQVVPILVAGLLAPVGSLLLLEQPELHLHMRAQARLGDFFVALSRMGKRCVIETHSDCLVNQMRLYVAKGSIVENPTNVQIFFADQDADGNTSFSPVQISANGNILNWPDGFFDQAILQEDAITHASLQNRVGKKK